MTEFTRRGTITIWTLDRTERIVALNEGRTISGVLFTGLVPTLEGCTFSTGDSRSTLITLNLTGSRRTLFHSSRTVGVVETFLNGGTTITI
jgi:hypothetical protein